MTEERPQKVFVLGVPGLTGVDSAGWLDLLPNLADYDHILVSTSSLISAIAGFNDEVHGQQDDDGFVPEELVEELKELKARLKDIARLLAKVLVTHGTVAAIVHPVQSVAYRERPYPGPQFIRSDTWQPITVAQIKEPGDTLERVHPRLQTYFDSVKQWRNVFDSEMDLNRIEDEIIDRGVSGSPVAAVEKLAADRQGNALGLAIAAHHGGPNSEPRRRLSGPFTVLVPPTEISDEEAIDLLLRENYGLRTTSPEPDWLVDISAPGEAELREKITAAEYELSSARSRLDELRTGLAEARSPLRVLYEKHSTLQEACEEMFEQIGITTKPSTVSDEFMLISGEQEILVEVKGAGKSAALSHISQLMKDMANFLKEESRPVKGVLIVNAWVRLPPAEREPPNYAPFPDNVVEYAENHDYALLDTRELYRAYEASHEGTLEAVDFFDLLMSTAGIVTLASSPASA